jgi:alkylation response protein AidB-like acyl-CoA dehydrogenase
VRRFVEDELAPHADEWETARWFPDSVFRRAGELGLLGLTVPEAYGGQGGDYWGTVVLAEELSRAGCGAVPMAIAVQTDMATPPILRFGTEVQKQRYLVPAVRGELVTCLGITEPEAGSDVAAIRTRAEHVSDGWVINGAKTFITNGVRAGLCTLVVRTSDPPAGDGGMRRYEGLSVFLVDTTLEGFTVARKLEKVGMHASDTAELHLDAVHVPEDALLGEEGRGFAQIMWELQGERLIASIQAVAGAQRNLERAESYARERHAFGRPIGEFQVQRHRLAEMATRIEAVRRLVYDCADRWNLGEYPTQQIAMCKLASAQLGSWVADETLQIHGGYGYSTEFPIERSWRDARLNRIGGGSDEVQREIIARHIGRRDDTGPSLDAPSPPRETALPLYREEHEALRASARSFVEREVAPHVDRWEEERDFPRELFAAVGAAGMFGMKFEERWGGSGPDRVAEAVWVEELSRAGSAGLGADLGAHSQLALVYVDTEGDDDQKARYLTPGIAGRSIGALAITEPGAGSDVAGITTRAERTDAGWMLRGSKVFITNGAWCDWVVVAARTGAADTDGRHGSLTLFLVDTDRAGVSRRRMEMLGWRTSHTAELTFDDVALPPDAVLGTVGGGFHAIVRNFVWERLSMSLGAVAGAERILAAAVTYADEREAFGGPIGRFQVWRHRFADLATGIAAGRALTEHALRLHVTGGDATRAAAMAKLHTQRMAHTVADECLQVHGGHGYTTEFAVERWWRDTRLGPIGGGTDEIMREIIARMR